MVKFLFNSASFFRYLGCVAEWLSNDTKTGNLERRMLIYNVRKYVWQTLS